MDIDFHTDTPLFLGLQEIFRQLSEKAKLTRPLNVYLAGGMAAHLYTATRVTMDVDAEFGSRIVLPKDLQTTVTFDDGKSKVLFLDTNYNSTLGLMHEDYLQDAIPLDLGLPMIRLHVLSPVDLAVSKLSRLADPDKADILALLRAGLTTGSAIEQRANEAMGGYVGNMTPVYQNLADVVKWAREESLSQIQAQNKTQAITSYLTNAGLKDDKTGNPPEVDAASKKKPKPP